MKLWLDDLALFIEEEAYFHVRPLGKPGRQNIEKAIQNAHRYWSPHQ